MSSIKKEFSGLFIFLILSTPLFAQVESSVPKPVDPINIVLIISDDHGWRDSGCYGNKDTHTPNLDRLAKEGVQFSHAFAASTLCSPSRAVIATGLMPFRNGGHVFGGPVSPKNKNSGPLF